MKKRQIKPGGRRAAAHNPNHRNTKTADGRPEKIDDMEMSGGLAWHSRYWAPRLNESDAFGSVTVYDAQGKVLRVIERAALLRPMPLRANNTWNNSLFPQRISDKV